MDSREVKGRMIAEKPDQVQRMDERFYKVASQNGHGMYDVVKTKTGWICSCLDHVYRKVRCKHIWAVQFSLKIREQVQARVIEPITAVQVCLYCKSEKIVKDGLRRNKYGSIQLFNCQSCGRYFSFNIGFERMKHNPQAITTAMQLYFSGESLRNTARSLRLLGVEVTHKTVFMWIKKYTALMDKYLEKITPQVSDTWRADEMFLKIKGNLIYLYALMDDETRFWIAKEVANTKYTADVQPLFKNGQQFAGKKPVTLITDGAPNFHEAYLREYWTADKQTRTEHIKEIRLSGKVHNNKMERFNGQIRDRERVMRTLEKSDTPILDGMQIYHNYIRPHKGLKYKTPAQAAGIEVKGKDKWLTIIQNASKNN
jgi:transposase-like protein